MQTPDIGRPPVDRRHDRVVEGVVAHGDKRGRLLGFPTANIAGDSVILEDGVWAGTVQVDPQGDGRVYVAAISLGSRPTYYAQDGVRLIEAFLLDFDEQIYGRRVRVQFIHRLRPQWGFEDSSHLVRQLRRDVADVEAWARQQGSRAVRSCPLQVPSYSWVAARTQLPVGYLRHRYPSLEQLRDAGSPSAASGPPGAG
ncbi:riboflavin kinase [Arthrobacter sp. B0490]|uniref:riboflavin kinase n=1 Tax=Arthrobacter sp. B0490 TaxID=2058891 RepID=UPI000CE49763|nr:riboflavin kinase [Arthrobacter sp. B0490]